ncbi:flagellar export chaperone FlgN [Proteiniborus sp.]|uniref:flagellar export chaperone FlgN n=1 Tax=Proteiniborus sp. TaxID=2079015 RepID=UPI0033238C8F
MNDIIYEMIALTKKKLESLNIILSLKPRQKEAIQQENMEDMESILVNIQSQIGKIDEIDSLYKLKFNELKAIIDVETISQLDSMKYPNAKILIDRLNEIKSVLASLKSLDDENNIIMNEKFEETKERLKNLRQGQKMAKGYFSDYNGTMFIDERN